MPSISAHPPSSRAEPLPVAQFLSRGNHRESALVELSVCGFHPDDPKPHPPHHPKDQYMRMSRGSWRNTEALDYWPGRPFISLRFELQAPEEPGYRPPRTAQIYAGDEQSGERLRGIGMKVQSYLNRYGRCTVVLILTKHKGGDPSKGDNPPTFFISHSITNGGSDDEVEVAPPAWASAAAESTPRVTLDDFLPCRD